MIQRKRKTTRLKNHDYSQPGFYFVTICTMNRKCMFGEIVNGQMHMNELGKIVEREWLNTTNIRSNVKLGSFVVMPNHVHGIININCRGVLQYAPTQRFRSPSQTIGSIIRGFKSAVTQQIKILKNNNESIWQRNFYEHVIRGDEDHHRIEKYIQKNPSMWAIDENNPTKIEE